MAKATKRKGITVLERMPNRMQSGSSVKFCEKHNEHFEKQCLACKREYNKEWYKRKKDPFA